MTLNKTGGAGSEGSVSNIGAQGQAGPSGSGARNTGPTQFRRSRDIEAVRGHERLEGDVLLDFLGEGAMSIFYPTPQEGAGEEIEKLGLVKQALQEVCDALNTLNQNPQQRHQLPGSVMVSTHNLKVFGIITAAECKTICDHFLPPAPAEAPGSVHSEPARPLRETAPPTPQSKLGLGVKFLISGAATGVSAYVAARNAGSSALLHKQDQQMQALIPDGQITELSTDQALANFLKNVQLGTVGFSVIAGANTLRLGVELIKDSAKEKLLAWGKANAQPATSQQDSAV